MVSHRCAYLNLIKSADVIYLHNQASKSYILNV